MVREAVSEEEDLEIEVEEDLAEAVEDLEIEGEEVLAEEEEASEVEVADLEMKNLDQEEK